MNFTKAAKRLFITQPALSTHISSIEKELGTPLLIRDQHGMKLTRCGEIFLEEAKAITRHYNGMVERIESAKNGVLENLRVGYLHYAYKDVVPSMVERLKLAAPTASITLYSNGYRELMKALVGGNVDVAFTIDCDDDIKDSCEVVTLGSDPLVLAVSKKSEIAQQPYVTAEDLERIPLLLPSEETTGKYAEHLADVFRRNGVTPHVMGYYLDVFSRTAEIEQSSVAAVVMKHFSKTFDESVVVKPIAGTGWTLDLIVMWKSSNTNPSIKLIVDLAKRRYRI